MKWFSVLSILALAFLSNACEKHPASELPAEHATAFGSHSEHEVKPAEEKAAETKPAAEAHAKTEVPAAAEAKPAEAKPGEAPKFFPETK